MLTFLWLASKAGYVVTRYEDRAWGVMTKNQDRIPWVSRMTLNPVIDWGGDRRPSGQEIAMLHEQAHHQCFIANSIRTEVVVNTEFQELGTGS
jgi:organic hydroperoxide reductase OsmC/OhrA